VCLFRRVYTIICCGGMTCIKALLPFVKVGSHVLWVFPNCCARVCISARLVDVLGIVFTHRLWRMYLLTSGCVWQFARSPAVVYCSTHTGILHLVRYRFCALVTNWRHF